MIYYFTKKIKIKPYLNLDILHREKIKSNPFRISVYICLSISKRKSIIDLENRNIITLQKIRFTKIIISRNQFIKVKRITV